MAGIYIHIPFCTRKCHYCNFFSLASGKDKIPFISAIKKEIGMTKDYLSGQSLETIYFGGGTPSVFHPRILQELIEMLPIHPILPSFSADGSGDEVVSPAREITMEVNPDDVTIEFVSKLKDTGFNRFSIGVQSFFEEDLKFLNRMHSSSQALKSVGLLQNAGFENISIDLIYGIPISNSTRWERNLDIALSLGVPHISAYALTVEPKTPLAWMIARQRISPVNEDIQIEQFKILTKKMEQSGYLHYEISNFCKPEHYSRHNTNYWKGIPYLGLGPSAHSFDGNSRRWNVSNLSIYIERVGNGVLPFEEEFLSPDQRYNEYVMTSLRTMWGTSLQQIVDDFGSSISDQFRKAASSLIDKGLLTENSGVYFLTEEGKLFADRIASDLFLVR